MPALHIEANRLLLYCHLEFFLNTVILDFLYFNIVFSFIVKPAVDKLTFKDYPLLTEISV